MNEKICDHCNVCKSVSEFSKDKSGKDGLGRHCKPCHAEIKNEQRHRRKQKAAELAAECAAALAAAATDEAKALPRTHTHFKEPYVPDQHPHRSDGNKQIKSHGMRC